MSDTLTGTATDDPRVSDGPGRPLPVRAAATGARDGHGQTAFPGADLGRQHAVADHRSRGGTGAVRQTRASASTTGADGFPHWNEHMLSTVNKRLRSVFTSDAEEHTRFRRMLSKPFTFKRVEGLRSAIQEVTDECIDAILAGPQPADIVTKLALPVPTRVISEMLGVPYEDHEFFQHHANVGLARYASAEDGQKGADEPGHKYLINLVETKMANPIRGCGVGSGRTASTPARSA